MTIDLLWADLIRRAFDLDALACHRCGGRMRLLATIPSSSFHLTACSSAPYRRAIRMFIIRREESIEFLRRLTPNQWERGSQHVTLGRMTYGDWVALMAAHDDNHLSQLQRSLKGQP